MLLRISFLVMPNLLVKTYNQYTVVTYYLQHVINIHSYLINVKRCSLFFTTNMIHFVQDRIMKLNTNLTVAIHTILCIAYFENDNKVTSDFIAGSTGMNPVIIRKILGKLQAAGIYNADVI